MFRFKPRAKLLPLLLAVGCCASAFAQAAAKNPAADQAGKNQAANEANPTVAHYRKELQSSPTWTEGWWRLGSLLYEQQRYGEAEHAFARLAELAPNNPLGIALLGLCEFEESDWNNAALHLNQALHHGGLPRQIAEVSAYDLAQTLLEQQNRGGAILVLKQLIHQDPEYPNLTIAFGAAELNLRKEPLPSEVQFAVAQLAGAAAVDVLKDQPKQAEAAYRELIQRYPTLPFAHLSFALFLQSEHRNNEAATELQAETKIDPNSPDAWLWLSQIELAQQKPDQARADAEKARTLDPGNPLTFLVEGRSYMAQHQWKAALPSLLEAEKMAPGSSEVHFALASTYAALHRGEEAKAERQLFLRTDQPGDAGQGAAVQ